MEKSELIDVMIVSLKARSKVAKSYSMNIALQQEAEMLDAQIRALDEERYKDTKIYTCYGEQITSIEHCQFRAGLVCECPEHPYENLVCAAVTPARFLQDCKHQCGGHRGVVLCGKEGFKQCGMPCDKRCKEAEK